MTDTNHATDNAKAWLESVKEMVAKLQAEGDAEDAARQEIEESVLSVQVRDGWYTPGGPSRPDPEEYEILLTTGGPGLRIFGELDDATPDDDPRLQWQDWCVPWTDYELTDDERAAVRTFARVFWFGKG